MKLEGKTLTKVANLRSRKHLLTGNPALILIGQKKMRQDGWLALTHFSPNYKRNEITTTTAILRTVKNKSVVLNLAVESFPQTWNRRNHSVFRKISGIQKLHK